MKKIENLFIIIFIIVSIAGCQQKTKTPVIIIDDETTKNQLALSELEIKAFADSLEMTEEEYKNLLIENEKTVSKNKMYSRKIHLLQSELDSVQTKNNHLTEQLKVYENAPAPSITPIEQDLISTIHRMHADWKNLPNTKDANSILQYFLPEFSVNQVAIDKSSQGHMTNYNSKTYQARIQEIIDRKDNSYEFGNVHFLDIEIKDQKFFSVAYKCTMRRYQNDKRLNTNSLLITITGKIVNNEWKIAQYSLVNFQYIAFQNITL